MKLDGKTVARLNLPHGRDDVIYFDADLKGFGFRLRATGGKVRRSWIAQYRTHGRTRRMLLGSAEALNAESARAAARKVLAKVALGDDPQAEKVARRAGDKLNLAGVANAYLQDQAERVGPRTLRELTRYLRGPYFRALHDTPIDRVTRKDVAARLLAIARDHGSIVSAAARSALSSLSLWAMQQGLAEVNPTVGTRKPQLPPPRDRTLLDAELAAIWLASGDDDAGRIVRLLILSGARRSEIGGMRWSEINFDNGRWSLPAARSKNRRAHTLPLPLAALEILAQVPRRVGREQLFGERAATGFTKWDIAKREFDERLGDKVAPWRFHDLRRSVATRMCDIGVQPHIVEQILNHQSGHRRGIVGVYNRSPYERQVKAALALWADHVHTIVGGERKVVAFPQAASDRM
jgi:integrase